MGHDTYFVVAHFHIVMGSASFFGMLAGVYHWYPKFFGRMLDYRLGQLHFWFTFIGIYLLFTPMHYMGIAGIPRRYYAFTSLTAFFIFSAQFFFFFNFVYSMFWGRIAPS